MSDTNRHAPDWRKTYKRPYRKSTKGCKPCKSRKTKCDETRPACNNCTKRSIDASCCQYDHPNRPKQTMSNNSQSSALELASSSMSQLVNSNPIGTSHTTLLELRLMHHYTRSTYGRQLWHMQSPTSPNSIWEFDIPHLAFSNDIVLNALLGIAAFNLFSLNPNDQALALASRMYWNKALVKQRDALSCVNRDSAEPLLVSAILLAHFNWLYVYSDETQTRGVDLSTYRLCQGATLLAAEASQFKSDYDALSKLVLKLTDHASGYDAEFMDKVYADIDKLLLAIDDKGASKGDRPAYEAAAADFVNTCSLFAGARAENSAIEHHIVTVLHRVSPRFVTLLEDDDPVALAIMARNLALLGVFQDSSAWWVHGAGNYNVPTRAVEAIAVSMPNEYKWMLDFPFDLLAKKIKVL